MNPATMRQILEMSERGVSLRDISAATSVPVTQVRAVVDGDYATIAAPKDMRLSQLVEAGRSSPRQVVRKLAERLDVVAAQLAQEVAYERHQRALKERLDQIKTEEAEIRRALKPKTRP